MDPKIVLVFLLFDNKLSSRIENWIIDIKTGSMLARQPESPLEAKAKDGTSGSES